MSSTDPQDQPTAPPSTDLEVKVDWLRNQLETVQADARRSAELAVRRDVGPLDEWVRVVSDYATFAGEICRTEFVPDGFRGKPESTTAAMMYGREVGLPPMTTLQNLFVVNGKVGMYAEQLRAMVLAAGHEFVIDEMTSHECRVSARRKDSTRWSTFAYTMDQARLTPAYQKNPNYKQRPVEMLFARVTGLMCHAIFPDVIRGMGVLEELVDLGDQASEDAVPVQATEEKSTRTVTRKKATPKAAVEAKPPAPPVEIPDETLPPLPGEAEETPDLVGALKKSIDRERERRREGEESEVSPAGSTPGEGRTTEPSTPAGPAPAEEVPFLEQRHCEDFSTEHAPHIWDDNEGTWDCQGVKGAPDTARVEPAPEKLAPGTLRLLQTRFKSLGFTDEPDDREHRLRAAAILGDVAGYELDSFRALTQNQAQQILRLLGPAKDRGDVVEMLAKAAQGETP